ncbi:hypothetical protein [Halosimplex sp. TS25]|uniref:hypothetical protein n=1 Tax=Halosimplex rarum TaxID=3396619 RepID=UPI0039E7F30B
MPLQFGIPGGIELLVILLMGLVMFGLPVLLVVVLGTVWLRSRDDYDDRIRELETEIARLQAQVGDGASGGATTDHAGDAGTDDVGTDSTADGSSDDGSSQ